ncbi:hypothetical protein K438DRAFT_1772874 [Mycena galopus ATCC 62051]|nr:hypothetical protein K438DRAFT_1772874 [Mycena galopus ATCC 62051]
MFATAIVFLPRLSFKTRALPPPARHELGCLGSPYRFPHLMATTHRLRQTDFSHFVPDMHFERALSAPLTGMWFGENRIHVLAHSPSKESLTEMSKNKCEETTKVIERSLVGITALNRFLDRFNAVNSGRLSGLP